MKEEGKIKTSSLNRVFTAIFLSLLLYLGFCSEGLSKNKEGANKDALPEDRSITFHTLQKDVDVYTKGSRSDIAIGKSNAPIKYRLKEEGNSAIISFTNQTNHKEEQIAADILKKGKIPFKLTKPGYMGKDIIIDIPSLLNQTRFPPDKNISLTLMNMKIKFNTKPDGVPVFIKFYGAQKPQYIGISSNWLDINSKKLFDSPFYSNDFSTPYPKYTFSFNLKQSKERSLFYKETSLEVDFDNMALSSQLIIPGPGKFIALEPTIPVISPIGNYIFTHKIYSSLFGIAGVLIIYGLLSVLRIFKEQKKRLDFWREIKKKNINNSDQLIMKPFGQYIITDKIGSGGMASVYRALPEKSSSNEDSVAIKVMKIDEIGNIEYIDRFKREIRISTRLNHPNILRILDFGEQEVNLDSGGRMGLLYIIMELIEGKTLKEVIPPEGFSIPEFLKVFSPILEAVNYAHDNDTIHRDLKPDNIMQRKDGMIIIMDFGLARAERGGTITQSGTTIGTPAYMSPEQASGQRLDSRTDQYSLGVVAYQMLSGKLPFFDENTINLVFKHITEPPPPLRGIRNDIPEAIERIVLRMLEKEPDKRFPNLKAVLDELKKSVNDIESRK